MGVLSPPSPAVSARVTARVTRPRLPFWASTGLQPLTSTDMSLSLSTFSFSSLVHCVHPTRFLDIP